MCSDAGDWLARASTNIIGALAALHGGGLRGELCRELGDGVMEAAYRGG
jgi:hypothetical protein